MNKENKRKIDIPFTLEQFKDAIERIKVEYNAGNLNLVGLFEIETLEYYCEQALKQVKLLELYRELMTVKENMINKLLFLDSDYYTIEKKEIDLEQQIKELEK